MSLVVEVVVGPSPVAAFGGGGGGYGLLFQPYY